ncbi:ABC bile acid [Mycena chlorophos]|uniref:ABC bile acid n=1 Tax=Mycena chlorophos TaxID=658473 RepID=A0A8H6S4H0_MYCCL|nr:ABC bile acid [Mycena chlorophos]
MAVKVDLTVPESVDTLFNTEFGVPDTVYCMHGIMSRGSEQNFDFGLQVRVLLLNTHQADPPNLREQVNFDSVRLVLQAARKYGANRDLPPIKFIFTSSLAVYGGPTPDIVTPSTIATPEGAYGVAKLAAELLVNEFSRRGFVDGRIIRLPTIIVRAGAPAAATSAFLSLCPIGDSIDSPELDLAVWVASPKTTVKNFIVAKHIPADKFLPHTRVVYLPGITTTIREELKALEEVGGKKALELVKFKDDPISRRLVLSWPARFDLSYPLSLGFFVDEGGMVPIVRQFQVEAGLL